MLTVIAAFTGAVNAGQQDSRSNPNKPYLVPEANRLPTSNDQMRMRDQKIRKQNFDAANIERKKQIADDSSKLLSLAIALKAELDNETGRTLSVHELRKADEIERLARNVKAKMELTVGRN